MAKKATEQSTTDEVVVEQPIVEETTVEETVILNEPKAEVETPGHNTRAFRS